MLRKLMRAKIHQARVTQCDLEYVGSITIDTDLLDAVGLVPNEAVSIYDIDNGARLETYVIRGERGSGVIGINGAAARLVNKGDRVIIVAYGHLAEEKVEEHVAKVVVCDEHNRIAERLEYTSAPEAEAAAI
jgi:aspartate 1-decarboxylase